MAKKRTLEEIIKDFDENDQSHLMKKEKMVPMQLDGHLLEKKNAKRLKKIQESLLKIAEELGQMVSPKKGKRAKAA
jgi:hypothetical protein